MNDINIAAKERTPAITFNFSENYFCVRGESYPEDVSSFYGPIIEKFEAYLNELTGVSILFEFEFIYFNSSSAKVVMRLFDKLEKAASDGNSVKIRWLYEEDDENMKELGEEFGEDLENAEFELRAISE
jgi:hypothetical protein